MVQKRYTIDASQEIIDRATTQNSSHCVIADAVRASIPGAQRVSVDVQTIRWTLNGLRFVALTPASAQQVIIDFDKGKKPEPFSLRIQAFQVIKAGAHATGPKIVTPVEPKIGGNRVASIQQPEIVGGHLPPLAVLSDAPRVGRRRAFGLRLLQP